MKLGGVGKKEAVTEVCETHRPANSRSRHGHEVHVQHGSQRRNAIGFDVPVRRVTDEARCVPKQFMKIILSSMQKEKYAKFSIIFYHAVSSTNDGSMNLRRGQQQGDTIHDCPLSSIWD